MSLILDATTKSLQFKLAGTVTTNPLPFIASYVDITTTATTPGSQDGVSNNTTAVTCVSAPAASMQRVVKNLTIQNADTANATVTLILNNNSTLRNFYIALLASGDTLVYEDGDGFCVYDAMGAVKTSGSGGSVSAGSVIGSAINLRMSQTSASSTSGTFTADQIVVGTSLSGSMQVLPSFSKAVNLGTTGAGGMDNGSAPASGYVSIYAIARADGTQSILACNVSTSSGTVYSGGNMPSGYSYSALIATLPTNGSSQIIAGYVLNREWYHQAQVNIFLSIANTNVFTGHSIAAGVPPNAVTVSGYFNVNLVAGMVYPNVACDSVGAGMQVTGAGTTNTISGFDGVYCNFRQLPIITSQTIYYESAGTVGSTSSMFVLSYTI